MCGGFLEGGLVAAGRAVGVGLSDEEGRGDTTQQIS